jgi:xylulokinase
MQLVKIFWLKQFAPDLLSRASLIAPLPTWLALRLGNVVAIDADIAGMSGLYSLQSGGYWLPALELCGLQENQLPVLVKAGAVLPSSRPDLILAGNDQTCGAIGNDCQREVWVVALGTALVAFRLAGHSVGPYHVNGCWGVYPIGGYYEYAVQNYGCAALDWAHQALFPDSDLGAFFAAAQQVAPSMPAARLFFYPDKIGTPSAWIGVGTLAEMALSVLEGIGFTLRSLIFDELGATSDLQKLIVTGGGSRSDFWLQLLADILGIAIQRGSRDSLFGAARLASSPETVPPQGAQPPVWLPDLARAAAYEDNYAHWLQHRLKQ